MKRSHNEVLISSSHHQRLTNTTEHSKTQKNIEDASRSLYVNKGSEGKTRSVFILHSDIKRIENANHFVLLLLQHQRGITVREKRDGRWGKRTREKKYDMMIRYENKKPFRCIEE